MNDFLEQLAREEVNPAEVREILGRLAIAEFGGPEHATIADVAEASGTSPETIGRILADIRGTSWTQWRHTIEAALAEQSTRIRQLELTKRPPAAPFINDVELYERVERGRREKHSEASAATLILIPVIVLTFIVFGACGGPQKTLVTAPTVHSDPFLTRDWHVSASRTTVNGHMFGYDQGCVWSERGNDGKPGPILHTSDADSARATLTVMNRAGCP